MENHAEVTGAATERIERAVTIILAFVSNNSVSASDLPKLLIDVHGALLACERAGSARQSRDEVGVEKPPPSQIAKSITPDALISFIDAEPYMMLKRHLRRHGLDPDSYRTRYGLPADYPMVAPNYSERRSEIARSFGLPHRRRKWPAKGDV
ncbi:Ros/MucR family transcriptional regulator [Methylorubrum extorquens]